MAPKPIGLADPRVDICSDRGNRYYEHDHPVRRGNTRIIPQDAGPDVFDIIREELEKNMVEKGSKFYIPRGTLREIVTPGRLLAVVQQLWASLPEDAQQQLCTLILYEVPCWKVFLLFIVTMQERLLPQIWKDENNKTYSQRLSDACLPLATFDAKALKCRDAKHTHPTPKLGLSTRQAMVSWSYAINAVYFKLPTGSRTNHVHYSLGPRDVLPYTATPSRPRESPSRTRSLSNGRAGPSRQLSQTGKQNQDTNQDENLHGGFGEVKRVVIDRSHFDFGHLGCDDGKQKELTFALKRLHASDKDAFNKELASLITVKSEKEVHLIKLLTTFSVIEEDGGSEVFYLLFPWAEGNLWNYWERYQPKNEQERLALARWMAQQCYELALALLCVHNERKHTLRYYQDLPAGKDELYGRHGDIKAENVLYFQADGSLVLSDFGLGRLHTKYSRSNADPKALEKSATYRAPEFDLAKGRISRASDVFSLGCMFLEFVTWHVMGYNAVYNEFPEYRMEEDVTYEFESDTFFRIEGDTAVIKPKVREWMDDLKNHKKASEYTKQFLGIIEQMLSPYPQDRIGVARLAKELETISRTCEGDPSYYGGESPSRSYVFH